jgi:hypothetical protein
LKNIIKGDDCDQSINTKKGNGHDQHGEANNHNKKHKIGQWLQLGQKNNTLLEILRLTYMAFPMVIDFLQLFVIMFSYVHGGWMF